MLGIVCVEVSSYMETQTRNEGVNVLLDDDGISKSICNFFNWNNGNVVRFKLVRAVFITRGA